MALSHRPQNCAADGKKFINSFHYDENLHGLDHETHCMKNGAPSINKHYVQNLKTKRDENVGCFKALQINVGELVGVYPGCGIITKEI